MIFATNNRGKLDELRFLLPAGMEVKSLAEAGLEAPAEIGSTFLENALIKARAGLAAAAISIADDSGLEVDALDGAPGVRSSRFAGDDSTDEQNNAELLQRLAKVPRGRRRARYVSVVALATADGREFTASGEVLGQILDRPRGSGGFGYDPLFEIADPRAEELCGRTMAELSLHEKNSISHRARAWEELLAGLNRAGLSFETLAASVAKARGSG